MDNREQLEKKVFQILDENFNNYWNTTSDNHKQNISEKISDVTISFAIDVLNDLRQRFIDDRIGHVYILDKKIEELQSLLK